MSTIHVDIPGLDLVLGGGIPAVKRAEDLPESATLLLRGPPGSGKSVFGTQIAGAIGRALGVDVAYGCVELLPHELRAQHEAFGRAGERVVVPPFPKQEPPKQGECRIFAAVLDIGSAEEAQASFGGAVIELLDVVEECGGVPRVLVIDSLSDGYKIGSSAPRELADRLCKLAASRGMFLVMLEETVDHRPSSWSFAADVVLELEAQAEDQPPDMPAPFDRRVTVTKNRFAPSDAGPHRFTIEPSHGIRLYPRPSAYLASWAPKLVLPDPFEMPEEEQLWTVPPADAPLLPPFRSSVTAVYGTDAALVFDIVRRLGTGESGSGECPGIDLFVDFGAAHNVPAKSPPSRIVLQGSNPFLSGNRFLAVTLKVLEDFRRTRSLVRRVLIGDFRSIRTFWNPDGIRRAVGVLITILRRVGVPAVLFETTSGRSMSANQAIQAAGGGTDLVADTGEPSIVDFADVTIEVATYVRKGLALMTDVRGGRRHQWSVDPVKSQTP